MKSYLKLVFNGYSLDLQDTHFKRLDTLPVFESVLIFSILIVPRKFDCAQAVKNFAEIWPLLDVCLERIFGLAEQYK